MALHIPHTVDYSGRQVDIELLQSIAQPVELQQVSVSSVTQTPKIVTGIQKLVQRYASLILQVLGTTHFDQENGSELLRMLMAGVIQNRGRLQNAFAISNNQVVRQLRKDDIQTEIYGTLPEDEQLANAQLLDYDIDFPTATIYLRIRLTSQAGDSLVFIVPTTAPR
jgi:hypothetical protein